MEQPLVVMIDPDEKIVYLYGEYNRQFAFDEIFAIAPFLEGRNVMYVVQADEFSGEDVLDQIEALNVPVEGEVLPKKFIRIKKEGYTWIPEIKMKFAGPKDAKPVDTVGRDIFLKSALMKKMLISGEVEIMTEEQAKALRKPRPDPKSRDRELDKMILNRKEDAWENDEMFNGENDVTEKDEDASEEEIAIKRLGFGK